MTKKLLALGCSFTKYSQEKDLERDYWPHQLALNLGNDWKSINLGKSGSSLNDAKETFLNYLNSFPNPNLVILGGTSWDRFYFGLPFYTIGAIGSVSHFINQRLDKSDDTWTNPLFAINEKVWESMCEWGININIDSFLSTTKNNDNTAHKIVKDLWDYQFKQIKDIKTICDRLNIPFVFYQLTQMMPVDLFKHRLIHLGEACPHLSQHVAQNYGAYIMDNIKNYPNLLECSIGGTFFENIPKGAHIHEYQISELDTHPNAKGHKLIGDLIAKHITKNFNI